MSCDQYKLAPSWTNTSSSAHNAPSERGKRAILMDTDGGNAAGGENRGFQAHPWRGRVLEEIHARPFAMMTAPRIVIHYAFMTNSKAAEAARHRLAEWCDRLGQPWPEEGGRHHFMDVGGGRLRWEGHAEFMTYSWDAPGPGPDAPVPQGNPFDHDFVTPGPLIVAVRADLVKDPEGPIGPLLSMFDPTSLAVSRLLDGHADAASDFHPDADGFMLLLIVDRALAENRAGPLVQRLIEIETYRTLTLLGLPEAQRVLPEVQRVEDQLAAITARIRTETELDASRKLLQDLTQLAGDVESNISESAYRFGATRAYAEIVSSRFRAIGEHPYPGYDALSAFLDRRMVPALRTCQTTGARQRDLSERLSRTTELLRTRVEIELEGQNRQLLESMDRRARVQLRLQQTVEGLSVVAISYYVVSLVAYAAEGIDAVFELNVEPRWVAALSIVPVALGVWYLVRRVRAAFSDRHLGD